MNVLQLNHIHISTIGLMISMTTQPCPPCTFFETSIGNGVHPKVAWSEILGKTSMSHAAEVEKCHTWQALFNILFVISISVYHHHLVQQSF